MPRYAENTSVSSDASRNEIERTLRRYGASQFAYGWHESAAMVGFVANGMQVRFILPMPDPRATEFTHTPGRGLERSAAQAEAAYEQAVRQRWRALALVIKAKLEAVETEIVTFEDEFLAHIVLPDGTTVSERVLPEVMEAYRTGNAPAALLPPLRRAIEA